MANFPKRPLDSHKHMFSIVVVIGGTTGMFAAFIAHGMSPDDALLLAVHLHGAAGDTLAEQGITIGMTASDVIEWARWTLNSWCSG